MKWLLFAIIVGVVYSQEKSTFLSFKRSIDTCDRAGDVQIAISRQTNVIFRIFTTVLAKFELTLHYLSLFLLLMVLIQILWAVGSEDPRESDSGNIENLDLTKSIIHGSAT